MWKQCFTKHKKAVNLDRKALERVENTQKNRQKSVRDQEVVGSSPVASTKISYFRENTRKPQKWIIFAVKVRI